MSDAVVTALAQLSRGISGPAPTEALVARVQERIAAEPVPRPSRAAAAAAWARSRGRLIAAIVVALVTASLVLSPVSATLGEWFGFHGVLVSEEGAGTGGTPTVPPAAGLSLDEAARMVGFTPALPGALGPPEGVAVSEDRQILSASWGAGDETIRLDVFDGSIEPHFWKASPDSQIVAVDGADALWFPTPHEVVVLDGGGKPRTLPPRLAGQTLVWPRGELTMRLEGRFTLERAVELADSVE